MHQFSGKLPEPRVGFLRARVRGDAVEPREDADDVAVENRRGLVEGDAANRAGGVAANAGQGENGSKVFRKFSVVLGEHLPRGFLKIADSRVVAEAFPKFVEFGGRGFGGGLNCRQLPHPAVPIWDHGLDLRLLEHDLGNPHGVRIARAPPGQVAGVGGEPE